MRGGSLPDYALFTKYRSDYQVDRILSGQAGEDLVERAREASFDERVSLIGLITDALDQSVRTATLEEKAIAFLHGKLAELRDGADADADMSRELSRIAAELSDTSRSERAAGVLSGERYFIYERAVQLIDRLMSDAAQGQPLSFERVKGLFSQIVDNLEARIDDASRSLEGAFGFVDAAFGDDQEMLMLVTDLSVSRYGMEFINEHGCDAYFEHNKALRFYERGNDLAQRIGRIDLDAE